MMHFLPGTVEEDCLGKKIFLFVVRTYIHTKQQYLDIFFAREAVKASMAKRGRCVGGAAGGGVSTKAG